MSHKCFLDPDNGEQLYLTKKYRQSGSKAPKAQKVFLCSFDKGFGQFK